MKFLNYNRKEKNITQKTGKKKKAGRKTTPRIRKVISLSQNIYIYIIFLDHSRPMSFCTTSSIKKREQEED